MMRRIFPDYAYGLGPRSNCWWDETCPAPSWPRLEDTRQVDVAIVGGGFTGLSTALHLAEAGLEVAVLEAETPGWGASGRNGGFCCIGGAKLGSHAMARLHGEREPQVYQAGEESAVHLVEHLIARHGINADTHSQGETVMAHRPKARDALMKEARASGAEFIDGPDLVKNGLGGEFHGALTTPTGFALNPRKYLFGLASAAQSAGAELYQNSAALDVQNNGGRWHISSPKGRLSASRLVIATNGYSSENLPDWLGGRYMPAQSTVMVTRPITPEEQAAQGWSTAQMAYDTRHMLHYFRLMPDGRFLFGMRGGLTSSPRSEAKIRALLRRHFEQLFPAWRQVETTHSWSGMVCLSRNLVPFVGAVPEHPGLFAGLCYHGNGVAMGSYAGALLGDLVQGKAPTLPYSRIMQRLPKFPLGRARRALMPPAYAALGLLD
ncbi:NAD(P)/FAD-dependent oxidoreductase [Tritonibacter scottomollicae]|uniref:Glycine/D-amino acid oxidase-like deaminating enzyme n=1 Tax=Tritonibacter scottomollicae TaxID=483013 RepID=A0A2T1ALY5_TRISK|nr:FAD-dependent oxidoreductase [Tritonibacter scottomollicae]PRZ49328.1 glycine/D-amino acid oxidase-like deaminating enzyme [Tritonibacter scottomollicae]